MENYSPKPLLSSTAASSRFGVTNDYIASLCRQKKVEGALIGKTWYVDPVSLQNFLNLKQVEREKRHAQLSRQFKKDYQKTALQAVPTPSVFNREIFNSPLFLYKHAFLFFIAGVFIAEAVLGGGEGMFANAKALTFAPLSFERPIVDLQSSVAQEVIGPSSQAIADSFFIALVEAPMAPELPSHVVPQSTPTLTDVVADAVVRGIAVASDAAASQSASVASALAFLFPTQSAAVVSTQIKTQPSTPAPKLSTPTNLAAYVSQNSLSLQLQQLKKTLEGEISKTPSVSSYYDDAGIQAQLSSLWTALSLTNKIDRLSNVTIVNSSVAPTSIPALSDLAGLLGVGQGGTGVSSTPTYGQLFMGNSAGGYDLVATSSLGISGSVSNTPTFSTLTVSGDTSLANATTTNLSISGTASTTRLFGALLTTCNGGNVLTWSAGLFGCVADQTSSGAANSFTWSTNYGVLAAATSSPLWATSGLFASSTSQFDQINVGSSTASQMATSTFFGNLSIRGAASTTNLFISSVVSGSLLKATTAGSVIAAVAGSDYATPTGAFDFTPTTNYAVNTSATSSPVWARLGLFASSTSQFDQVNVGSSTSSTLATSTFFGNLSIRGAASTTNLFISSVVTGSLLKATTAGSIIAAVSGSDYATPAQAYPFTATTNYGVNTSATSTALFAQVGLFASSTSNFDLINIGSSTTSTLATSTFFGNLSIRGAASTTNLFVSSVVSGALLKATTAGSIIAAVSGSDYATPAQAYNFTPTTNYAVNTSATTTPVWFKGAIAGTYSLMASSTAAFDQLVVGSSTTSTLATSTFFGNLSVAGSASSTNLFVSSVVSGALLKTTTAGSVIAAVAGSDYATPTAAFDFTATTNYAVNTSATTTPAWFKGAIAGTYSLMASSTSAFDQINVGSSTTSTLATSTFFGNLSIRGAASTTNLFISSVVSGALLKTTTAGNVIAAVSGSDYATPAQAYNFTPTTNYGVNTSATSTALFAQVGLFASSTSQFDVINIGSSTSSTLATSTFFGNLSIRGAASTTNLYVSSITTGSLLKATTAGSVIAAVAGSDYPTVAQSFNFTPTTSFGSAANSTSTLALFTLGLSASSTIKFGNAGVAGQFTFVSSTGNLGLGTSSPSATLTIESIASSTNTTLFAISSSTNTGGVYSTTTLLLVTNRGNVGIGTSTVSTTTALQVQSLSTVAGTAVASFVNSSGTCYISPTSAGITCSSDIRLKYNIESMVNTVLDKVMQLTPVTFNWNNEPSGTPTHAGFIAQQVEPILPDLVSTDMFGMKSINYGGLTPYLTAAIQEITAISGAFREHLIAWLGNATNGIGSVVAGVFQAKEKICVDDQCLTKDDIRALLVLTRGTTEPSSPTTPTVDTGAPLAPEASSTPPVVEAPSEVVSDAATSTTP